MAITPLNTSLLATYYASGASFRASTQAAVLRSQGVGAKQTADVIPPWQFDVKQNPDTTLERVFSSAKLIDLDDPLVSLSGDNETYRNLFALYRGLTRVRELVDYAENGKQATAMRGLMDRKFQEQLAQIGDFAGKLDLGDLALVPGVEQNKLTSSIATPKALSDTLPVQKGASIATARDQAIAGLNGTETFTLEIATAAETKSVAIDLSQVSGPLNVDNIAAYIDDRLASVSALSKMAVERYSETSYGFRFDVANGETLTLKPDPATQEPAVYVAGASGFGDSSSGFVAKLDGLDAASPETAFRANIDTTKADDARAVAVDSKGYVYVVGSSAGDMGADLNGEATDAYLRKLDAAGNVVWSRLLGSPAEAGGFAVAVDGDDNIVVAGQTRSPLTDMAYGGGYDSFVTKFDAAGSELWTRQAQPFANDAALSLAVDASGAVFVAGRTDAPISAGLSHGGGSDAYLMKLDASGALAWSKQFGGAGDDAATALAVDGGGNVFVAAQSGGHAVVRKYADEAASQTPAWEVDLGALGDDGALRGIALGAGGAVYVSGSSANAALAGATAQAHSGGMDAFVSRIVDGGASASADWTSYVGSGEADEGRALTVRAGAGGDEIYLAGATGGSIAGAANIGGQDAFVAKLDQTGATQWAQQIGGAFAHGANAIALDETGTSVVSRLGLPTGPFPQETPTEVVNRTAARAGQYFEVAVNEGSFRRIAIDATDSFSFLAFKINKVLGSNGRAKIEKSADGLKLTLEALHGGRIDVKAGAEGKDALGPLGLRPATLFAKQESSGDVKEDKKTKSVFSLGFTAGLNVKTKEAATDAGVLLDNAMREVRALYQRLNPTEESRAAQAAAAQISGRDAARIASLQFALDRLTATQQQQQPQSAGLLSLKA
jgi:hypothetical protein